MSQERTKKEINASIFKDICLALSAIAVPVMLGIASNWVSISLKESDVELRKLELAISLLSKNPDEENPLPGLRSWAAQIVGLSESAEQELMNTNLTTPGQYNPFLDTLNPFLGANLGGGSGVGFGGLNPLINGGRTTGLVNPFLSIPDKSGFVSIGGRYFTCEFLSNKKFEDVYEFLIPDELKSESAFNVTLTNYNRQKENCFKPED